MTGLFGAAASGFLLGGSLIIAIGAQNAFILRQGLLREHVFVLCLICSLADAALIATGVGGLGTLVASSPRLIIVVTGGGAWALGLLPGPSSCAGGTVRVAVAAQPEIAPALRDVAARFNVEEHRVGGRCVRARVTAVAPAEFARRPELRRRADAWVPESSVWLGIVHDAGDGDVPPGGTPLAATPVVLAMTRPVAEEFAADHVAMSWKLLLKDRAGGVALARRAADPAVGTSGMLADAEGCAARSAAVA